jgi:hypothetical protein
MTPWKQAWKHLAFEQWSNYAHFDSVKMNVLCPRCGPLEGPMHKTQVVCRNLPFLEWGLPGGQVLPIPCVNILPSPGPPNCHIICGIYRKPMLSLGTPIFVGTSWEGPLTSRKHRRRDSNFVVTSSTCRGNSSVWGADFPDSIC